MTSEDVDEDVKKTKASKGKNKAGIKIIEPEANVDDEDAQVVDQNDGNVDVLSEIAMENAYLICHNVQDLMYFRGFYWEGAEKKGKGKKKKR